MVGHEKTENLVKMITENFSFFNDLTSDFKRDPVQFMTVFNQTQTEKNLALLQKLSKNAIN